MTKFEYTKDRSVPDPSSSPLLQSKALHAYKKPADNAKMNAGEFSLNLEKQIVLQFILLLGRKVF